MSTTALVEKLITAYRRAFRDHPDLNLIVEGYESSATSIHLAMMRVISEFNSIHPYFSQQYTLETFPDLDLLLYGIAAKLAEGSVALSVRNDINVSPDAQNTSAKLKMLSYLRGTYENRLRELKRNIDHQALYRGAGGSAVQYSIDAFLDTMTGVSEYSQLGGD